MTSRHLPIQINPVTGTAALAGWGAGYTVRFFKFFSFLGTRRKDPQPQEALRNAILGHFRKAGVRLYNGEVDELVKKIITYLERVFSGELEMETIQSAGESIQPPDVLADSLTPHTQSHRELSEPIKGTFGRILVVQDSPSSLKDMHEVLRSYGDCVLATNGKEALRLFRSALEADSPFTLVCLDITTPETNGLAVLKRIRSLEAAKGILGLDGARVAVVTTSDGSCSTMKNFREQCEAYLIRPITEEKMRNVITSLGLVEGDVRQQ